MSGAQGAMPPGAFTPTTYEMVKPQHDHERELREGGGTCQVCVRENPASDKDSEGVPVVFETDKVPHATEAAGAGGPVFGNTDNPQDLGVSGTSA